MATRTKSTNNKTTKSADNKGESAKKPTSRKKNMVTHEDIAQQAYILWLERGGSEMENWLEAERQLQ